MQRPSRAFKVAEKHYNIGNDLFKAMLDKRMLYSCGYWKEAKNLEEAQEKKLHLIFQKLQLKPGMRVLDIGCGWGGAANFAAKHYGVSVHGVTVSTEQAAIAQACQLPSRLLTTENFRASSTGSIPSACSSTLERRIIVPISKLPTNV